MKWKNTYIKKDLVFLAIVNITILVTILILIISFFWPSQIKKLENNYQNTYQEKIICNNNSYPNNRKISKLLKSNVNLISCSNISNKELFLVINTNSKNITNIKNIINKYYEKNKIIIYKNTIYLLNQKNYFNISKFKKEILK